MTKRKTSNNNSGCGTLFVGILVLMVIGMIIDIFYCVLIGVKICLPFIVIILITLVTWKVIFYITHRKPLTYEQAHFLAQKTRRNILNANTSLKKSQ